MSFSCDECQSIFSNRISLGKHRKSIHGLSAIHKCEGCDRIFSNGSSLSIHRKICLLTPSKSLAPQNMKCGICGESFRQIFELCAHLRESHDVSAQERELKFRDADEFEKWIATAEERGNFEFVRRRTAKTKTTKKEYMYCHRSGTYESGGTGLRVSKKKGSNKCGFTCSTFAFASKDLSTGRMTVNYCLTHYKHDHDVARIRVPDEIKTEIAEYLRAGKTVEWILETMRNDFDTGSPAIGGVSTLFSRRNCITRDDVKNVATANGLPLLGEKNRDDSSALWNMVHESWNQLGPLESPFFFYQPQTEENPTFTLGIQTRDQMQMLTERASWTIVMDSTLGNQRYGLKVISVLAVDESGRGFPCAWLISESNSERILTEFFQELKNRCGLLVCDVLMSEIGSQYYRSWINAFCHGNTVNTPLKLLSLWHVRREWRQELLTRLTDKSIEQQAKVWHRLLSLLKVRNRREFDEKLANVLASFQDVGEREFARCFRLYYCDPDQIKEWALWARQQPTTKIDMYVEEFYRTLREKFLDVKENRRVDSLASALVGAAKYFLNEYVSIKKNGGRGWSAYYRREMRTKHEAAVMHPSDSIRPLQENVWSVVATLSGAAATTTNSASVEGIDLAAAERHVVQLLNESCDCQFRCAQKNCRVCPFMYSCTCFNPTATNAACEHMHLVHMMRRKEKSETIDVVSLSTDVPPAAQTIDVETEVANNGADDLLDEDQDDEELFGGGGTSELVELKETLARELSNLSSATEQFNDKECIRRVLTRVRNLQEYVDEWATGGPPAPPAPKRRRTNAAADESSIVVEEEAQPVKKESIYVTRSGRKVVNKAAGVVEIRKRGPINRLELGDSLVRRSRRIKKKNSTTIEENTTAEEANASSSQEPIVEPPEPTPIPQSTANVTVERIG